MVITVKRGDIYYADLSPVVGSEQGGMRPVLVIQNDVGNRYSPTVIAAAITSRMGKTKLPTHIEVRSERAGLQKDSVVLLEQVRTLDKRRLKEKMGHLDEEVMASVDDAVAVSLGLLPHGVKLSDLKERARGGRAPLNRGKFIPSGGYFISPPEKVPQKAGAFPAASLKQQEGEAKHQTFPPRWEGGEEGHDK